MRCSVVCVLSSVFLSCVVFYFALCGVVWWPSCHVCVCVAMEVVFCVGSCFSGVVEGGESVL